MNINDLINPYFTDDDYITNKRLLRLCEQLNIPKNSTSKNDLFNSICQYASQSSSNETNILQSMDVILKEGIKHLYLRELDSECLNLLKVPENVDNILRNSFPDCPQCYICNLYPNPEFKLQNYSYEIHDTGNVSKIHFAFTKKLLHKKSNNLKVKIIYPMFATINLDKNIIEVRLKSLTHLYDYNDNYEINDEQKPILIKNIVIEVLSYLQANLSISTLSNAKSNTSLKNKLFVVLNDTTVTPSYIRDAIDKYATTTTAIAQQITTDHQLTPTSFQKLKADLEVLLEKYISVDTLDAKYLEAHYPAFPIKISATDSEQTSFSTVAACREPLQCKERFFDTKRALQYEKVCDTLSLCFKRANTKYFGSEPFVVSFDIAQGWCIIKWLEFLEEEDINNVLSRFI